MVTLTSLSTVNVPLPSGKGKVLVRCSAMMSGVCGPMCTAIVMPPLIWLGAQPILRFCQVIEPPPDTAVQTDDKDTHEAHAQGDAWPVTLLGGAGDIGPQSIGRECGVAPRDRFGNDTGVPGTP